MVVIPEPLKSTLGFRVPFVNCTLLESELLGELAEGHPFACGWYQRADGRFVYHLRSRNGFDCSEVAKLYGGGGHVGAAGFTLDKLLPIWKPEHDQGAG